MSGNRRGIVKAKHFKADGGTAPSRKQAAEHLGLQKVMVGVIMPFTEKQEMGVRQTRDESWAVDESGRGRIPDTAG